MNEKIKELLAVLDWSKDEQWEWLEEKYGAGGFHSFPTLAFRLRDEFLENNNHHNWEFGLTKVWKSEQLKGSIFVDVNQWANKYALPIHWIIAALIAKELQGGGAA
jgi:hypothetical protein